MNIKGYSGKKRDDIIQLIKDKDTVVTVVSQKQDTGKFRTNTKDQFYTNENVAKSCISSIINIVAAIIVTIIMFIRCHRLLVNLNICIDLCKYIGLHGIMFKSLFIFSWCLLGLVN